MKEVEEAFFKLKKIDNTEEAEKRFARDVAEKMKTLGDVVKNDILNKGNYMKSLYSRFFSNEMIAAINNNHYAGFRFLRWLANYTHSQPHIKNVKINVYHTFQDCWADDLLFYISKTEVSKIACDHFNKPSGSSESNDSDDFIDLSHNFSYWTFSNVEFNYCEDNCDYENIEKFDYHDKLK